MPDLYQELSKLADSDMYPFHMPGHKRNVESTPMKGAFRCDITEIDDFDNLHDAKGILLDAQQRANKIYGADETFFLINGSTCGVLSALSAAVTEGGTVVASRGSHRSFYNAVYLRHLNVRFLPYKQDTKYGIPETYTANDIEEMISDEVEAVFITSPTYEGKCSDIREIADLCHKNGIPLIVDAAHGAHFGLESPCDEDISLEFNSLPESAIKQGADLVIHSLHKTLPSMTQTALLHVQGNLVDRKKLKRFLSIYQTSSPSYVLMASMDLCIKEMEDKGNDYVKRLLNYRNRIQQSTSGCKYFEVPGVKEIPDAAKVMIYVKNAFMTGQELYDILREEYKLQLEMAGDKYVLAIISGWDSKEGIERLIAAINSIDKRVEEKASALNREGKTKLTENSCADERVRITPIPEKAMAMNTAWDSELESIELKAAYGRISGGFINLYPPGIPLILPGERFSEGLIEDIAKYLENGLNIQGVVNRKEVLCVRQK
ncbi:MAG: aminotransferase class I/II-fold pyridoxal phosphate-dependent enzyme [Butyrivibrio sp.]|nr:aminotransferase class I/II-fold pyridoxal phosphate-dependent enzyme [Butyrivibrio sp.]